MLFLKNMEISGIEIEMESKVRVTKYNGPIAESPAIGNYTV